MKKISEAAIQLLYAGDSFVEATILSSSGSTPRAAGASMIVRADGSIVGTVGGGVLEAHILKSARQVINDKTSVVADYVMDADDAASIGAICGGRAKVLIEHIDAAKAQNLVYYEQLLKAAARDQRSFIAALLPSSGALADRNQCLVLPDGSLVGAEGFDASSIDALREALNSSEAESSAANAAVYLFPVGSDGTVYIFGAGHCGEKLAHIVHTVGFATVIIDDRSEFANSLRYPEADEILVPNSIEDPFEDLEFGPDSYIVIVTRGHMHDELVLDRALKTSAGYIGMIGSTKKRQTIYQHLLDKGHTQGSIDKVYSPIGISIGAESPEEIAVSIAAELIRVRADKKNI